MSDLQLYHQLTALPDDLKKEVELFIQFLLHKQQVQTPEKKKENLASPKVKSSCTLILTSHWKISKNICDVILAQKAYFCIST